MEKKGSIDLKGFLKGIQVDITDTQAALRKKGKEFEKQWEQTYKTSKSPRRSLP
jgi:hypothetical protein